VKRTKDLNLGLLASVAAATLAMSGCGGPGMPNAMARRCVDGSSAIVDDRYCDDEDRRGPVSAGSYYPYRWYYGGPSGFLPVGQQVGGGTFERPAGVLP
jgi:hypothetical protein